MTYTATLSPDSTQFTIHQDETILNAALRQGLNLPHSCKSGSCGQCKAIVSSGNVTMSEYLDHALSAEEVLQHKVLLCSCTAQSDVQLTIPGFNGSTAIPVKTIPTRVENIHFIHDVAIVKLTLPKAPAFVFYAGQYINLLLPENHERSYSIATAPIQTGNCQTLELHIRKREGGVCSEMIFGAEPKIKEKSIVRIRGPLGSFTLQDNNRPIIMLATGTGFAPIRSLLLNMIATQNQRPVHFYWGARQQADIYAFEEAQALCNQLPHATFTPVLSQANNDWQGKTGYIQSIAQQDYPNLSDYEVYACGLPQMIESAFTLLTQECQLPNHHFFSDEFTPHKK